MPVSRGRRRPPVPGQKAIPCWPTTPPTPVPRPDRVLPGRVGNLHRPGATLRPAPGLRLQCVGSVLANSAPLSTLLASNHRFELLNVDLRQPALMRGRDQLVEVLTGRQNLRWFFDLDCVDHCRLALAACF